MTETHLVGVLLEDVHEAHRRHQSSDTPSSRRDLVRTLFAAIDGFTWNYREFVRECLGPAGLIYADEELALSEVTYSVSRRGVVSRQPKYIPVPSAIRLACRIVERAEQDLRFDFSAKGWSDLLSATEIRNRITHPKAVADLGISDEELHTCLEAFYWLLDLVQFGMEKCILVSRDELEWTKMFVKELNEGNPRAWAEYLAAEQDLRELG